MRAVSVYCKVDALLKYSHWIVFVLSVRSFAQFVTLILAAQTGWKSELFPVGGGVYYF